MQLKPSPSGRMDAPDETDRAPRFQIPLDMLIESENYYADGMGDIMCVYLAFSLFCACLPTEQPNTVPSHLRRLMIHFFSSTINLCRRPRVFRMLMK